MWTYLTKINYFYFRLVGPTSCTCSCIQGYIIYQCIMYIPTPIFNIFIVQWTYMHYANKYETNVYLYTCRQTDINNITTPSPYNMSVLWNGSGYHKRQPKKRRQKNSIFPVMWIRIDCIRIRIHKVGSIRIRIQVHKISKFSKHLLIFESKKKTFNFQVTLHLLF